MRIRRLWENPKYKASIKRENNLICYKYIVQNDANSGRNSRAFRINLLIVIIEPNLLSHSKY